MAVYRLTNRRFSREWRRSKDYSDHEIRWLAKRRGLNFREHSAALTVTDQAGVVVANFTLIPDVEGKKR